MAAIAAPVDVAVHRLLLSCLGCIDGTAPQVAEALETCHINLPRHTLIRSQRPKHLELIHRPIAVENLIVYEMTSRAEGRHALPVCHLCQDESWCCGCVRSARNVRICREQIPGSEDISRTYTRFQCRAGDWHRTCHESSDGTSAECE